MVSLPAGVTPLAISAGYAHSLANGSDGKLYSWGLNQYGELGNGSNTNSNVPVIVNLPLGVTPVLIATQCQHNLTLGSDGKLYAWGANGSGQLGDGTTTDRNSPVVVNLPASNPPTTIATGRRHSLAIAAVPILSINNVTQNEGNSGTTPFQFTVSLSYAISQTVTVNYATADGTATVADNDYQPISGTLTIPAGAITGTLTVLVNGDSQYEPNETFKVSLSGAVGAVLSNASSGLGLVINDDPLPVTASGPTYEWGFNGDGELGDNTTTDRNHPVLTAFPAGIIPIAIAIGRGHNLAIGNDGNLYVWGDNVIGELGDGTNIDRTRPVSITLPGGASPRKIAAGGAHSLVLSNNDNFYTWGDNFYGELGDGTSYSQIRPITITLPGGIVPSAIAAGYEYSMAIGSDGILYTWGHNNNGQLGDGTTTTRTSPVSITLSAGVSPVVIAAGYEHALAIGSDGKLYEWGRNDYGQLGDSTTISRTSPVAVNLPAGVIPTAIAAGDYFSMALGTDGKLYTWGDNSHGQLGDGSTTSHNSPVAISLPTGVAPTTIAAGSYHSLAVGTDGKLYSWGDNSYGQLGDGTAINQRNSPVAVSLPIGATPSLIAGGVLYSLAVLPSPALTVGAVSLPEGNSGVTPFNFTVSLSYATNQTVTLGYATADGTATVADNDYQPTSGTLTIPPGAITGTVTVLVNGDTKYEPDETFTLTLSSPTGAVLGSSSVATGTILNDDTACNPLLVTTTGDDGSCGTLRAALAFASSNPTKTVSINLAAGSVISLTTALTLTSGVSITTTAPCGIGAGNTMLPPIIIQGVGTNSGNGLTLSGHNNLYGLWVRGFSGVQIKAPVGSSTKMQCVRASKL